MLAWTSECPHLRLNSLRSALSDNGRQRAPSGRYALSRCDSQQSFDDAVLDPSGNVREKPHGWMAIPNYPIHYVEDVVLKFLGQ